MDEHMFVANSGSQRAGRTRERVRELLGRGLTRAEVARQIGVTKATVSYHARRLGEPIDDRCNRRYDWREVQRYYDDGHSVTDCQNHFGFTRKAFHDAWKRGDVVTRPQAMPIEQLLGGRRNRTHLKRRLVAEGLKEDRCEICGLVDWRGAPLALQLHHRNGRGSDNRLENLAILCPNCHSQTDTWGGRNRSRRSGREAA